MSIGSLLLAGGVVLLASIPARAADFYFVTRIDSEDDASIEILDPASIAPGENGHRFVNVVDVEPLNIWADEKWEVDCSQGRVRAVERATHAFGPDDDNVLNSNNEPEDWQDISAGTNVAFIRDAACQWPDKKPATQVFSAPDLLSVVRQISAKYY